MAAPGPAHATPFQIVSSDAHGVTLRVDVPAPVLTPPDAGGRVRLSIDDFDAAGEPGRPTLPTAAGLVALPPGARAVVRVVTSGAEDVLAARLVTGGKPTFHNDGGKLGLQPTVEPTAPIADGPWPGTVVELGEPFTLRHQRLVALRIHPVRYDEATGTVWTRRSLVVRVDFQGGTTVSGLPVEDQGWDAVLEKAVLNFDAGRAWRTPPAMPTQSALGLLRARGAERLSGRTGATGAAAFDEDNPEVRCVVDTTGIYALTFANLSLKGFPAGIADSLLSVHRHEFVPGGNPAYVTVELPIEVDDRNGNGVFDANDRIYVFVQNWAERSRASIAQRAWGDAEVVYATYLTGRAGLRPVHRSGWNDLALAPLASYRTTQRYEGSGGYVTTFQLGIPGFTPAESDTNTDQFTWTEHGLYDRNDPSFTDVFPFVTNDLDNTRPVNFAIQWVGFKETTHISYAEVRNGANQWTTAVDSAQWYGRITTTYRAQLPGTAVTNGATNAMRIFGRDVGTPAIVYAGLNWFDVGYYRRYKALAGQLKCNSDSTAGDYQITATGFTSRNIRVWDVTDSLNVMRLDVADSLISNTAPYTVRFQDTSPGGAMRRYVVFDIPTLLPAAKISAVTRRDLAGSGVADDIIIAPEALLTAADRLAAHRQSQGLRARVFPLESVNDEFNGGRRSSYSIRRLLQYGYTAWNTKYVTLFGDGSEDPLNHIGTAGPDLIPAQKIAGPVGIPLDTFVYESVVSDPWYVWCLSCAGAPSGPFLHDMFIGRLPVATPQQASDVVDKLIQYDDVRPEQVWRRHMMLCADDAYSTSTFTGQAGSLQYCHRPEEQAFVTLSAVSRSVLESEGGYQDSDIEIFDLGQYLLSVPKYYDPDMGDSCRVDWHATQDWCHQNVTPILFNHLGVSQNPDGSPNMDGRVWWNFEGHANPYVLTHEDLYRNLGFVDDQGMFDNVDKPFLFSAFSCHPNAFGTVTEGDQLRGASLGEDMVNLPRKGAIGSWASTGYELLPTDYFNHLTEHFARAMFVDPARDPYLGQGGARSVLGEAIALALVRNFAVKSGTEAQVGITYTLLGDPTTRLSIGPPQSTVTANLQPVSSGDPVRLRTAGNAVRLDADLVSNVRLASIVLERTVAGVTTVVPTTDYTITPAFPDTGAASKGGRRFKLTYNTTLTPEDYTFTIRTTDRYGVVGTFDAVFRFQTVLKADGATVGPRDAVSPNAALTLTVLSPAPLTLPQDLTVEIDSVATTYTFTPANGDTSGHEWTLQLTHGELVTGHHVVDVHATGGASTTHPFSVVSGGSMLRNALSFPNPFEDVRGTVFSFDLASASPADVELRVYTVTGRLIYRRTERSLIGGYHQLPWDGKDAEGQVIANGLYLYRLLASNGSQSDKFEGRLIKLRRPRRATESTSSATP